MADSGDAGQREGMDASHGEYRSHEFHELSKLVADFHGALAGIEKTKLHVTMVAEAHALRSGRESVHDVHDLPADELDRRLDGLLSDFGSLRWEVLRAWEAEGSVSAELSRELRFGDLLASGRRENHALNAISQRTTDFPTAVPTAAWGVEE